jgi:hypothetical protein
MTCLRIAANFVKSLFGPQSFYVFLISLTVICEIFNRIDSLTEFLLDRQSVFFCELRLISKYLYN